jgi:hypothetical protein
VCGDLDARERALEQRHEAAFHGQRQRAVWTQGLQNVGQHVGEHDLVAEALLGGHHQGLALQVLPRPAGSGDVKARRLADIFGESGLVGLPAFDQLTQAEQDGRPGERHRRGVLGRVGMLHGLVAVGQGAREIAHVHLGESAVVIDLAGVGSQARGFIEEDDRALGVAGVAEHGAQRIPEGRGGGIGADRGLEDLDRFVFAVQFAQRAGQVVGAFDLVRPGQTVVGEELRG